MLEVFRHPEKRSGSYKRSQHEVNKIRHFGALLTPFYVTSVTQKQPVRQRTTNITKINKQS